MSKVIVNDAGEVYGGYSSEESRPIWFKTLRPQCVMPEEIAQMALKQLKQLGHEKVALRDANGIKRKWVPADLDAAA